MIKRVVIGKAADRQLDRLPRHVVDKLLGWVLAVETRGLEEVRRVPGYHDEPLKGARKGERSIRLSRSYRAIYVLRSDGVAEFVSIEEVNKHDY